MLRRSSVDRSPKSSRLCLVVIDVLCSEPGGLKLTTILRRLVGGEDAERPAVRVGLGFISDFEMLGLGTSLVGFWRLAGWGDARGLALRAGLGLIF